jgi:hypothetical protein
MDDPAWDKQMMSSIPRWNDATNHPAISYPDAATFGRFDNLRGWLLVKADRTDWTYLDTNTGYATEIGRDNNVLSPPTRWFGTEEPIDPDVATEIVLQVRAGLEARDERYGDEPWVIGPPGGGDFREAVRVKAFADETLTCVAADVVSLGWAILNLDMSFPRLVEPLRRRFFDYQTGATRETLDRSTRWPAEIVRADAAWSNGESLTADERNLATRRFRHAVDTALRGALIKRGQFDRPATIDLTEL